MLLEHFDKSDFGMAHTFQHENGINHFNLFVIVIYTRIHIWLYFEMKTGINIQFYQQTTEHMADVPHTTNVYQSAIIIRHKQKIAKVDCVTTIAVSHIQNIPALSLPPIDVMPFVRIKTTAPIQTTYFMIYIFALGGSVWARVVRHSYFRKSTRSRYRSVYTFHRNIFEYNSEMRFNLTSKYNSKCLCEHETNCSISNSYLNIDY